jgi:hypothetical protein
MAVDGVLYAYIAINSIVNSIVNTRGNNFIKRISI